ncbi:tetratricopeptide repeat protein [Fulvivirga sp. RKSG066]|nr:tetratricopeptide repeat protein [Fulvivirga aurantia]
MAQSTEDYEEAIKFGYEALQLAEEKKLIRQKAECATTLGILYYNLGDYKKTLDFFYQALSANTALKDTFALAKSYNNIGLILSELGRMEETIKYHKLSLEIKQSLNDTLSIANTYSNLGLAYQQIDSLDIAFKYFRKALEIDLRTKDAYNLYTIYNNIGKNHYLDGNYDSTSFYYDKAIMLSDQIDNKYNKAEMLLDYAYLNVAQKQYGRAMEKFNTSLRLAEDIGAKSIVKQNFLGISEVYEQRGNTRMAFAYYQKYDSVNALLFNEEQSKMITEIERNYQLRRSQKEIELLKKESEIKDLRIRSNIFTMYFLIAAILLVAVIVFLQFRKNIYKTRTNQLLQTQNEEIAEKNKNIMDSIFYAKNIQKAILPTADKLQQIFKDAFVYSKARDVVSGDFYWFAEKGDHVVLAAVDCTGHGVPAAFLNVLGNSHLNNIVVENDVLQPAEILIQLNQKMLTSMHGNNIGAQTDDGMDIALCLYDRVSKKLTFAGAKRPLYYFHKESLHILKGDSHPVGGDAYPFDRSFTQHELQLNANDCIYLFTDGIVDQFGGNKNKKFMYPRLRDLLSRIFEQPMEEQLMVIKDDLLTWKGQNQQTDDILIIGVKV